MQYSEVKLSIIIPVLNESEGLQQCLQSLQDLRQKGVEVIVVDGGSADATLDIAAANADQAFVAERGRARQMNAGAQRACGKFLLFLHADTALPQPSLSTSNLLEDVDSWLSRGVVWGFFPVRLRGRHRCFRVIERAISWRSRLTSVATGDQAIFVCRHQWLQLQGFKDIPLMEDVELSKRLRKLAAPEIMPLPVTTDSRRWERHGIIKTVLLMWSLRLLYFIGFQPRWLAPKYGINPRPRQSSICIAQLAKAPIPGQVKTRMQPYLSAEQSAVLHRQLVERVTENMSTVPSACYQLWVTRQEAKQETRQETKQETRQEEEAWDPLFESLRQRHPLRLMQQPQGDLGQRMFHICETVLEQFSAVVLVGSDCPFLSQEHINAVSDALAEGHQAVIVPAEDGGYALLALTQAEWRVFEDVDWGTERVLSQTLERLQQLGWRYQCLSTVADIDRPEDLQLLAADASTRPIVEALGVVDSMAG